ncbi:hypothetical protein IW261DRAFT_1424870 [Armillaria novae-zelandiae]|uniref:Uncharacterized protein n=1 Tax=Armillaria novae-zelandiae TaxID=153914 RepID=A0AA39NTY8_9AGAR|nr:hypothetical protein IW261DRAFT_1424870 [Armillaria novae-zelandiae]
MHAPMVDVEVKMKAMPITLVKGEGRKKGREEWVGLVELFRQKIRVDITSDRRWSAYSNLRQWLPQDPDKVPFSVNEAIPQLFVLTTQRLQHRFHTRIAQRHPSGYRRWPSSTAIPPPGYSPGQSSPHVNTAEFISCPSPLKMTTMHLRADGEWGMVVVRNQVQGRAQWWGGASVVIALWSRCFLFIVSPSNYINNSALASSAFPPSYEVTTSTPPPYDAIYTLIQSDIHMTDTVEPTPLYSAQYTTPLDDIGMAGFTCSGLTTIFEEDVEDADDTVE